MAELGLHDLRPNPGSTKTTKRLGRGKGSGQGKTAGKGHKGYNSRSGGGVRPGYEGGQTPLYMRLGKLLGLDQREGAVDETVAVAPAGEAKEA